MIFDRWIFSFANNGFFYFINKMPLAFDLVFYTGPSFPRPFKQFLFHLIPIFFDLSISGIMLIPGFLLFHPLCTRLIFMINGLIAIRLNNNLNFIFILEILLRKLRQLIINTITNFRYNRAKTRLTSKTVTD